MKKLLNRRIAIVAVAVIATVAFFSFKSGDDLISRLQRIWIYLMRL